MKPTPAAAVRSVLVFIAVTLAGGCVEDAGIVVILKNQIPEFDSQSGRCEISAAGGDISRNEGILDLAVSDAPNYFVYPVVQSRLPALAVEGRAEPNMITLTHLRVTIQPPPGFPFTWSGCGNSSDPSFGIALPPGATGSAAVEAILPCQAKQILEQFKPGGLNPDLTERVYFSLEMRAFGTRSSGDEIKSDPFRVPVRVCVGCLQTGFSDLAQYNYPALPMCGVAPRPNPHKGNPCNLDQDIGPVLCCLDNNGKAICPSPDQ
jgi:hypothetical protein